MNPISRRQAIVTVASSAAAVALPFRVQAQDAPIRIVVGYPPGGGADRVARLVSDRLQAVLKRTVIVENRAGAGGRLAAQQLVDTPPSQTVLMLGNPAVMSVAPVLYKDLRYDVKKDFVPVAGAIESDFGMAVGSSMPIKEVSHLMAWIRANPDKANAGVPATGSLPHFFALMLAQAAQVKIEIVGYRGSSQLLTDLIGGQVPFAFDSLDVLLPQHDNGKVRVLATSGATRSVLSPKLPTFKEQGLPVAAAGWSHFFAPSSMPQAKVEALGESIKKIMAEPEMRQKLLSAKLVPMSMGPAETAAAVNAFNTLWQPVIKRSGIQADA